MRLGAPWVPLGVPMGPYGSPVGPSLLSPAEGGTLYCTVVLVAIPLRIHRLEYLKFALEILSNGHECSKVVKLAAIIWSAENRYQRFP